MPNITASEWTKERVEKLITDKIEENNHLDYKGAGALNRAEPKKLLDVTKDISAFANSDGGTVIYGVEEFREEGKKHLPEKIGAIDGKEYSREWLDQIIDQISPKIEGVQIFPVRVGPEDWHVVYVVEIPKSLTAHQARDFRYYKRYNFQSEPMQDYEVRDVMNRRRHPKLKFSMQLDRTGNSSVRVIARIRNIGSVVPKQYGLLVFLPTIVSGIKLKHHEEKIVQEVDGFKFWRFYMIGKEPLFPGADVFCEDEFAQSLFGYIPTPAGTLLICTLYADEMPPIERRIPADAGLGWQ
ncbi:MAG TPA: ATP-binding protein [Verrucomicrobiae bacterium]|nr:ATP-binding protein [Verrucomicrobiae bacterium]